MTFSQVLTIYSMVMTLLYPKKMVQKWSVPLRILLSFFVLVLLVDCSVISFWISPLYIVLFIPLMGWLAALLSKQPRAEIDPVEGCNIGDALDLENPRKPRSFRFVLQDKVMGLGMLVLGAPGAGKTYLMVYLLWYISVEQSRLLGRRGWLYNEGKGDSEIYQMLVSCGAGPDRFFSSELEQSDSMNLFLGETNDVIDRWTRVLIDPNGNPFYVNAQRRGLQSIIPLLKGIEEKSGVAVTLRDLFVVFRNNDAGVQAMELARSHGVDARIIGVADEFFEAPFEERLQIQGGMLNRLFVFVNGKHTDRINDINPSLVLSDCVDGDLRVYNHLPLTEYSKDLAFVICEELGSIARRRQNTIGDRTPFQMFMDDWGGFFYDGFGNVTARVRSAGMPVHFAFQSKGQMDKIDSSFADTIDDTVSTKIFLRLAGMATRRWASEMMGTFEDITYNVSDKENDGLDGTNMSTSEQPRVRTEDFRRLHDGQSIISSMVKLDRGLIEAQDVKVRFPLAPIKSDYKTIQWPEPNAVGSERPGLNFWDKFMSDDLIDDEMISMQWEARRPKDDLTNISDISTDEIKPVPKVKKKDEWDDDEELFS